MSQSKPHSRNDASVQQHKQGPTSIQGAEASELLDKGRGPVETDPGKEGKRNLPHRTGGDPAGDVGLRGTPDIAAADDAGGRKRN